MKVGLPGVGVGGVFYLLLVAWMPFRELWLTLNGRSSRHRWRRVAVQLALAGSILAGLWAEWWAMTRLPEATAAAWLLLGPAGPDPTAGAAVVDQVGLAHLAPALAWAPFAIIALILAGLHLLRLATGARRTVDSLAPARAAAS